MENNVFGRNVKVRVYGRVQGVFFRYHTKLMADGLEISGWVKNCPDGSVETFLSGSDTAVEEMISWLHQGPETANVESLDISEIADLKENHTDFTIRY